MTMESSIGAAEAQIYKIQTLIDGGARVTLDLGYNDETLLTKLIQKKMRGDDLVCVAFVEVSNEDR